MDASVRQILDPRVLTSAYAQMPGIVPTPFTDTWFVNAENIDGDTVRMFYDPQDSEPSPANEVGAEARVITTGDAQERIFNLFYSFNKTSFQEDVLNALREPDSPLLDTKGRKEVARVMNKFVNRQKRFKELVIARALTQGVVYLNSKGQILESSSGAVKTCDFQIASTHQGNLDGLVSGLFSATDTLISDIIEGIDDAAASANVPPPTDVWVNKLNLKYLRNNTQFHDWAQFNEAATAKVLQGGIIEDLWGKTWHFVGTKYKGADGAMHPYIPLNRAVFTPPPGDPWVKATSGSTVLPSFSGVVGDVEEALGKLNVVYGSFAYAKLFDDPVRVMAYIGDKFGFHFAEPNAIWQATAFPAS